MGVIIPTMRKLMTTTEAQGYLKEAYGIYISTITISKYARAGLIGRKITQRWYFTKSELDGFVSTGTK